MKRYTYLSICCFFISSICFSQLSSSFELRYFSKEKENIDKQDFSGNSSPFDTEKRVEFLEFYAEYASKWFSDSSLNTRVNQTSEISRYLKMLKPKPLPEKRDRLILDSWMTNSVNQKSQLNEFQLLKEWNLIKGDTVTKGILEIVKPSYQANLKIDTINWRFSFSWRACSKNKNSLLSLAFMENKRNILEAGFHSNGNIFFTDNGHDRIARTYEPNKWYNFKVEVDLANQHYNLSVDNEIIADWIALKPGRFVNNFQIKATEGIRLDDLSGLKFDSTGQDPKHPYSIKTIINQSFDPLTNLTNWSTWQYDDQLWNMDTLPVVKGGELEKGEDLYLRKFIRPPYFKKAWLNIESLDPGGEVWINGEVRFVTNNPYPIKLDISDYLEPFRENIIGIRVYSNYNEELGNHAPSDRNIGWFCGRAWIDFTENICIQEFRTFTKTLNSEAKQYHHVEIENYSDSTFNGSLQIDYYPWFPDEEMLVESYKLPISIFPYDSIHINTFNTIKNPLIWTHDSPKLYKIHVSIRKNNKIIDDQTYISGIRTVSQEGGTFRINGKPELLAGVQTMGFRMPIENVAKWNRCPPENILMDEILASKKVGNTLRIHIHAGGSPFAHSINDPRIAEMADQLGLMLIWPTTAWIREGEWGGIDFNGYPKYMEQVFNHPSIIIWEGSNHPNRFKGKPTEYSNRFISKIYNTIYSTDSSRLISPSSYNILFAYRNDEGTIDENGNEIAPAREWTAPKITRGNQDGLAGYGATWDRIKSFPDKYRKSLLESKKRAYFNFEHEESIGMQNFSLAKGKAWYQLPSYENMYDVGSIGREFSYDEWKTSQAWQAFSAWESMKWQRLHDIDGFSWCCLHGGANSGTYRKPIIDALGHAKLSFYINQMALQDILAGSDNINIVYYKNQEITPAILNVGEERNVSLKIIIRNTEGNIVQELKFENVHLPAGRTITKIPAFKPKFNKEGYYFVEYFVLRY